MIPIVKGKLTGMASRVPTTDVSAVDLTGELKRETGYGKGCAETKLCAEGDMRGL